MRHDKIIPKEGTQKRIQNTEEGIELSPIQAQESRSEIGTSILMTDEKTPPPVISSSELKEEGDQYLKRLAKERQQLVKKKQEELMLRSIYHRKYKTQQFEQEIKAGQKQPKLETSDKKFTQQPNINFELESIHLTLEILSSKNLDGIVDLESELVKINLLLDHFTKGIVSQISSNPISDPKVDEYTPLSSTSEPIQKKQTVERPKGGISPALFVDVEHEPSTHVNPCSTPHMIV